MSVKLAPNEYRLFGDRLCLPQCVFRRIRRLAYQEETYTDG